MHFVSSQIGVSEEIKRNSDHYSPCVILSPITCEHHFTLSDVQFITGRRGVIGASATPPVAAARGQGHDGAWTV